MRFSTSALVVVLLQNSSLLSPNDAFSPPLSRVVKSSSSLTKNDGLYAQCDDDSNDDNDGTKKEDYIVSVIGRCCLSTFHVKGISRRKHIIRCNDRSITKQWWGNL